MKKTFIGRLGGCCARRRFAWAQAGGTAASDEPLNLEQLLAQFNWDFDAAEITTEQVGEGLSMCSSASAAISPCPWASKAFWWSTDMFPESDSEGGSGDSAKIGGDGIDFAINTHWHFDHAEGNLALGPAGTWIVGTCQFGVHDGQGPTSSTWSSPNTAKPPYPPAARPSIVFDDRMRFHFNGEDVDLIHAGPGTHRRRHCGDFQATTTPSTSATCSTTPGYPFIDVDSGGSINGMIAFCQAILDETRARRRRDSWSRAGHRQRRRCRRYIRHADDGARSGCGT